MTAVSVIVPAYLSERTLERCLDALRAQTLRDFELIVVDSSPLDRAAAIVARAFPSAIYLRSPVRLWPQAARNEGARRARGAILVFTDPDIYPPPDWLARLVEATRDGRPVVLGSIACHGERLLDRAAHLCKFSICLPGGRAREVRHGWSGNIAVTRAQFDAVGGWEAAFVQGDSVFGERLRRAGAALWFDPRCVVEHDHAGVTLAGFLGERFRRGREYARLEVTGVLRDGRWARALTPAGGAIMAALLPARVAAAMRRLWLAAREAGLLGDYLATAPLVLLGVGAWYAGMGRTYLGAAFTR